MKLLLQAPTIIYKTSSDQYKVAKVSNQLESFCRSLWHLGKRSPHLSGSALQPQFQRIHPSVSAEHQRGSDD